MMKRLLMISSMIAGFASSAPAQHLVPMPRELKAQQGTVSISPEWKVEARTASDKYAAGLLNEDLQTALAMKLEVVDDSGTQPAVRLVNTKNDDSDPPLYQEQGYEMEITTHSITITAPTNTGRFYGVQTLRQLVRSSTSGELPVLSIRDWPALEWRGISDDISRGQVSTLEDFKNIIRDLALYKVNVYQPYMEDMFEFSIDPDIGRERGHITKTEMAVILEECQKNHVLLIPIFQCLGHQDRLLRLPQNQKYAEMDVPSEMWSFSIAKPEAFEFVKQLIDEVAEAAPSSYFHIGGDESWEIGKGASREIVEKDGVAKVHARYYGKLANYLRDHHKRRMLLYSDMILNHIKSPDDLADLPKDAIFVDWHYSPTEDFPSVRKLREAGYKDIIVSPAVWGWSTFYPNYDYSFRNITRFAELGKSESAIGCITSLWGDNGAETLRATNDLGYAITASAGWETTTPTVDEFLLRYAVVRYGISGKEMASIEKELGWFEDIGTPYYGDVYHRAPRIRRISEDAITTFSKVATESREIVDRLFALREGIKFNPDYLDILQHISGRMLYVAMRELNLDNVYRILQGKSIKEIQPDLQEQVIELLTDLRDRSSAISAEYERLWLRRNKFPMLNDNLNRLHKQTAELQSFLVLAQSGELRGEAEPEASWIWYPEEDKAATGTRYLVYDFELNATPTQAILKMASADRAILYANGHKVLEPVFRTSGSADIRNKLVVGVNRISIEAENALGAGAILAQLDLTFQDRTTLHIETDGRWLTSQAKAEGWMTPRFTESTWKPAKVLGKGLVAPWNNINW